MEEEETIITGREARIWMVQMEEEVTRINIKGTEHPCMVHMKGEIIIISMDEHTGQVLQAGGSEDTETMGFHSSEYMI